MTDKCELCNEDVCQEHVVLNGHIVCYDCVDTLSETKEVQIDEDGEEE